MLYKQYSINFFINLLAFQKKVESTSTAYPIITSPSSFLSYHLPHPSSSPPSPSSYSSFLTPLIYFILAFSFCFAMHSFVRPCMAILHTCGNWGQFTEGNVSYESLLSWYVAIYTYLSLSLL